MLLHSRKSGSMSFLLLLTLFLSACGGSNTLVLYDPSVTPIVAISSHMAPTTLSGGAAWIHNCQAGWKAYQAHPTYRNGKGEEKPRDVYLYGHFWLQPSDGSLWDKGKKGHLDKRKGEEKVLEFPNQNHAKENEV